ncbi:MAG TPA: hypothetical protein P5511_02575, partial [Candidatus Goldiibacteriota bacterium]|nr:hypothetical protein [Candidatus Goldiibacteriota bacterium]
SRTDNEPISEDLQEWSLSEAGIKAGVEFFLNEMITLRAGFDYVTGGGMYKQTNSGTVVTESENVGTGENPALSETGIGFGAGLNLGFMEVNAACRLGFEAETPTEDGYKSKSGGSTEIIASAIVPF